MRGSRVAAFLLAASATVIGPVAGARAAIAPEAARLPPTRPAVVPKARIERPRRSTGPGPTAWSPSIARAAPIELPSRPAETAPSPACGLPAAEIRWIQRALDAWERAAREFLRVDPTPLPWIVLFDATCTWHVAPDPDLLDGAASPSPLPLRFAGEAVPVFAERHGGAVRLPNGSSVPAAVAASASLYRDGTETFLILALPSLWRSEPRAAADPRLGERILSVVSHEIVHTRQLVAVARRIEEIRARYRIPASIDDNVVQRSFGADPAFRRRFEEERDLFYRAALEPDAGRGRALARKALRAARRRRSRFFRGEEAPYADLEAIFLAMEGAAEWARFKLEQAEVERRATDAEIVAFLRGRENDWSQDEGLALYLLLERMAPDWPRRSFGDAPASPFDLLAEALEERIPAR